MSQATRCDASLSALDMSLTAILSARMPALAPVTGEEVPGALRALLPFGGATFIEHQARQAIDAGARSILIHVDTVPPALARVVDRLGVRDDLSVEFVRDIPLFASRVALTDRVLCLGDGMLVPQDALSALAASVAPRLLVTPRVAATDWLERIDAQDVWAGAILLPGDLVLATLDMLGEWDFMSTLVRVAVQKGAGRLVISPQHAMEGQLAQITSTANADLALEALSADQSIEPTSRTGLAHRVTRSFGLLIAGVLIRRQVDPQRLIPPALVLAGGGVLAAALGWAVVGLLALLAGQGLFGVARQAGAILLHRPPRSELARFFGGASLLSVGLVAGRAGWGQAFAPVAVMLVLGLLLLVAIDVERAEKGHASASYLPSWLRLDLPTALAVMLFGAATGWVAFATGLVGLAALAEIAFRRHESAAAEPQKTV